MSGKGKPAHTMQMKICRKCKKQKSTTDFYKRSASNDGLQNCCKSCSSAASKIRYNDRSEEDKKIILESKRIWNKNNRKRLSEKELEWKYGLSSSEYQDLVKSQGGLCAICKTDTLKLHVDHCHTTGKVRGLLCSGCNTAVGFYEKRIRSSIDVFEDYLRI